MIRLRISKSQFSDKFYPYLNDWSTRWFVLMGGAGSGKSYFITQKIILRCINEPITFAVCRRYATTLRNSCFALFKEILTKWKLTPYVKIKETDMSITFPNGSKIIMLGLDEETKLLSLANISGVWCEEAYEIEKSKIEQLNLRMRGIAEHQQIILSFNPISQASWLYDFCEINPPKSFTYIISTYKDNPFLNKEYVDTLDEMAIRNPRKYEVYGLAHYGVDAEGLVFQNWKVEEFDPVKLSASGLEYRCGSDLGYIDPTTVVQSLYDKKNNIIYVFNEFYKRGCQLDEVYDAMIDMKIGKAKVYMDAAEPRTIDYFKRKGVYAVPCIKGAGSVNSRITFLQNHQIIIHPRCVNLIKEFSNFSYERDKHSGELKESYTHEWSHGIDGLGYAYSDIYTKNGRIKSFDKALLGL